MKGLIMGILNFIAGIAGAVKSMFELKATPNRQRREAERDVAAREVEIAAEKASMREAVYSGDDERVNDLMSTLLIVLFTASSLVGCIASRPTVKYIPTDRRIESCTNSLGISCKAVPDAVFCEMTDKLIELKYLKSEMSVDKRLNSNTKGN